VTNEPPPDLQAICDICVQPIADGEGHVWVERSEAIELTMNTALPDHATHICDLSEVFEPSSGASENYMPWRTTHTTCCPVPSHEYGIAVERIRTWAAYLHWTVHVTRKPWLWVTDWHMFVLRSLEPDRGGLSGVRPKEAQSLEWDGIGGHGGDIEVTIFDLRPDEDGPEL
jgi:hypothetical protein